MEAGSTELKATSLLCHCWLGWTDNGKSQAIFILQQVPVGSLQRNPAGCQHKLCQPGAVSAQLVTPVCISQHRSSVWVWGWPQCHTTAGDSVRLKLGVCTPEGSSARTPELCLSLLLWGHRNTTERAN